MIYKDENLNVLARHFETIEDPRGEQGKLHRLIDIFVLTIYGALWGFSDLTNMALALKYKEEYFKELLGLKHGVPSHDTFSAVFSIIHPQEFLECFLNWMAEILTLKGKHVAIDGKAVRAACEKVHGKQAPVLVNAFVVEMGLCVGQIRVDEKTNEIKGIPELIEWLDLEGAVVSIDAIGCQKEIAELLLQKGADFVFQVKDNQRTLRDNIFFEIGTQIEEKNICDANAKRLAEKGIKADVQPNAKFDVFQTSERNHSRIERRTCYVLNDNACVDSDEWPHIASVGMVFRERLIVKKGADGEIIDGEPSYEHAIFAMSKTMDAQEFDCYTRGHWGIENSLHWVLDDFFREDRCTARVEHATQNLALMRKIIFNLTKLDINVKGMSMKAKQIYYQNNPDAIAELIFCNIQNTAN